jgi:uncharacterized membrane protein YgdD (TMEM256/DUF423 family)
MPSEKHPHLHFVNVIIKFKNMAKTILMIASILLALAVALGAFGAHGLKSQLSTDMLQTYKTGVEYHFYHALGLLLIGILAVSYPSELVKWSAILLTAGIILFSGSLYVLAISGIKWLGAITPLGGISFIAGWVLLFLAVWKEL